MTQKETISNYIEGPQTLQFTVNNHRSSKSPTMILTNQNLNQIIQHSNSDNTSLRTLWKLFVFICPTCDKLITPESSTPLRMSKTLCPSDLRVPSAFKPRHCRVSCPNKDKTGAQRAAWAGLAKVILTITKTEETQKEGKCNLNAKGS